jgi:diadenylate cyclase
VTEFLNNLFFIFQRVSWLSVFDILLVTLIFFGLLYSLKDTQAMALLRGLILLVVAIILLTSLVELPAFSWFARNSLPALILSIPVIFAPEIRRALERLGRASNGWSVASLKGKSADASLVQTIRAVVSACARLSARQHGALIVLQRLDNLEEYIQTGVPMNARVTPEILLQIFYPNTPLHDGGVIIVGPQVAAASCVMPLSASGVLNKSPERQMGLRHRAALGTSEVSDAIAVVVSEETGAISIAHAGRMLRRLDPDRLENILLAFFRPQGETQKVSVIERLFPGLFSRKKEK